MKSEKEVLDAWNVLKSVCEENDGCCRKCNLRIVTRSQNGMNRGVQSNNKTGVTGVTFYEPYDKWNSQIVLNGKHINLGYFSDFEDAVKARKEAEEKYFREYSYDNSQKIS